MALPTGAIINGVHYDPSSYEIRVNTTLLSPWVRSLTYPDKLTPTKGYGQSPQPLLRSRGTYDPSGAAIELYKFAADQFEQFLSNLAGGNGLGEAVFTVFITLTEQNFATIADQVQGCRAMGFGNEMPAAGGAELTVVKYDLDPMHILHNGKSLVKNSLFR
jgi:hypothetical protein